MSRRPARNRPPSQSSSIISGMAQPLNGVFKMSMGLRPASRGSAPFDQGAMDEQYATAQPRHLVRCSFQIIALSMRPCADGSTARGVKTILSSAACRMKESLISKVTRRAQRFLSMGLISWSKARSFPLCGVEVRPSDSTPSRSHRLAWRVTPRSIRKRSCVKPSSLGRTAWAQPP